jgi:hypothetical protein
MLMSHTALITIELLSGGVWVGSMVCLAVIARVSAKVLEPRARVTLFASVGRAYAVLGTGALAVAVTAGMALAGDPADWSDTTTWALGLATVLFILTVVAMAQARRMTTLRRAAATGPGPATASLRSASRRAGMLRAAMGVLTVAVVVLAAAELSS